MGMIIKRLAGWRSHWGEIIEHICYKIVAVIQSYTETCRTLTTEERRPTSQIAAP